MQVGVKTSVCSRTQIFI